MKINLSKNEENVQQETSTERICSIEFLKDDQLDICGSTFHEDLYRFEAVDKDYIMLEFKFY